MNFFYFMAGMIVFWSVLLTLIGRFEKRMTWPYGPLSPDLPFEDPQRYGRETVADAQRAGFTFLGWAADIKGPKYKASYGMLLSPERDILAVVGVGTIVGIKLQAIWLHTPSLDGRSFYSVSHQSGVTTDISGHWQSNLCPNARFDQLLLQHREWINKLGVQPRLFTSPARAYDEFRSVREEHHRYLESQGLIRYTDAAATHFQSTWSAAFKNAVSGYFLGMARALAKGKSETR